MVDKTGFICYIWIQGFTLLKIQFHLLKNAEKKLGQWPHLYHGMQNAIVAVFLSGIFFAQGENITRMTNYGI